MSCERTSIPYSERRKSPMRPGVAREVSRHEVLLSLLSVGLG